MFFFSFSRNSGEEPRLRDAAEKSRQLQQKQEEIAAYRSFREDVEAWRERDRQNRNNAKIQQLELCERMQVKMYK